MGHGINFAIRLAKNILKSQFSRISTGTNTGELSLFFLQVASTIPIKQTSPEPLELHFIKIFNLIISAKESHIEDKYNIPYLIS